MAHLRVQVAVSNTSNPLARDHIVNVFYLGTSLPFTDPDATSLAEDTAELWATFRGYPNNINTVTVKIYDMADATPRPIKGQATTTIAGLSTPGPREVALCLSYFADRNLPRKRGRMYIGPWRTSNMEMIPGVSERDSLQTLAEGISGLGGPDIQWVQHSTVDNSWNTVTDYWIDDEWDTMRSRGLVATVRTTGTVDG